MFVCTLADFEAALVPATQHWVVYGVLDERAG